MIIKDDSGTVEFSSTGNDANKKQAQNKAAESMLIKLHKEFPAGFAFKNAAEGFEAPASNSPQNVTPSNPRPKDASDGLS